MCSDAEEVKAMRKPTLYILCGCPGAGKSTWANNFIKDHDVRYISRDEVRYSLVEENEAYFSREDIVFAMFALKVATCLSDGEDVIADATHLNKKSRRKLIYGIDRQGVEEYQIIFVYFNVSYEVCCERNKLREGRKCVPEDALLSMYNNFQEPQYDEDKRCIGIWGVGGN